MRFHEVCCVLLVVAFCGLASAGPQGLHRRPARLHAENWVEYKSEPKSTRAPPESSSTEASVTTSKPHVTTSEAPTTKAPPATTAEAPTTKAPPATTSEAPTTKAPPATTAEAPTTKAPPATSPHTPATTSAPATSTVTPAPTTVTTEAPTTTAKPTPPHCTPGQKKVVPGTCRNYVECDKTFKWVPGVCNSFCQNFDPKSGKCVWAWKYHCVEPTTVPPTTGSSNPDEPTTQPSSTTKKTHSTTKAPPATTAEAPTTKAPPATSPATTSTPITTTKPNTPTETTTKPTTPPSTTTAAPKCTKNGEKKVIKGDCKDYLECDSGLWKKHSCSWGYDFDINKLECRWSWWAKCS